MSFPAMKQTITVTRAISDGGGWGGGQSTEQFDVACRADEVTEKVQNQLGDEVISTAQFMMAGLVDIRYSDTITFEDELGRKIERSPVRIEPLRWFNGKPRYTVVYV